MRGLVGSRKRAVAQLATGRIDHQPGTDAPAIDCEYILAVHVTAGAHAQFAQDTAVEIDGDLRVRGIQLAPREEMGKVRCQHVGVIGDRLQLAGPAFLAAGTYVVALDEQHLQQRPALVGNGRGTVVDIQAGRGRLGAGRDVAAIDVHHANPAAAVWCKFGVVTQVRDVCPRPQRRIHNAIAFLERDLLAVQQECLFAAHDSTFKCAAASSRPVMALASASAASRSNDGP